MNKSVSTTILISLFCVLNHACSTHENSDQVWQKGNLHTHSFWSDGDDFPEMIINWYKNHDYQFIAISDHNTIANNERWYKLSEKNIEHKVLEKYIESFGDWVETSSDSSGISVRLKTFNEYKTKLEDPENFLIIRSEEVTSSFDKKPIHINVTNVQEKIEPQNGNSVVEVIQKTLDRVHDQRIKLGIPMFAHLNHPNFGYGVSTEDIKKIKGERFFEVYNGHPAVNNQGNENFDSTETMWDLINIHYFKEGKPLLLGIATDDSHNYHEFSEKMSNTGRGWVMVNSNELTATSLIDSMEKGNFYASTGVFLKSIKKTKKELMIEVDAVEGINYQIIFLGYKKDSDSVDELKRVDGAVGSYVFKKEDIFVRATIISDSPIDFANGIKETRKAWVQPHLLSQ